MAELKREYYPTGELKFEHFMINGQKIGEERMYYINGQLKDVSNYVNNELHGESTIYYKTGGLFNSCIYVNGKKHGKEMEYCQPGDPYMINHYNDGELVSSLNLFTNEYKTSYKNLLQFE